MKKLLSLITVLASGVIAVAQSNVMPAPPQKGTMYIKNALIHVGDGKVIENGVIEITDGKISKVGKDVPVPAGANVQDVNGKHVYPGLILPTSNLGLVEISAVRASNDSR